MSTANGQDTLLAGHPRPVPLTTADHRAVHYMTPATACGRDARRFVRDRLDAWGWPHLAKSQQSATNAGTPDSGSSCDPDATDPVATDADAADPERAQATQDLQDILLLTSELAINAAEHARTPLDLTVQYWPGHRVRIEVHDDGGGHPVARWPTGFEESGRGLALVDLMSESWGVTECAVGKTVWFEFRLH